MRETIATHADPFEAIAARAHQVHGDRAEAMLARLRAFSSEPDAEQVRLWLETLELQATSPLPEAVIFDMDGTLCDVRGIRHYVRGRTRTITTATGRKSKSRKRDFDAFHRASNFCPPNEQVAEMAQRTHARDWAVVVVTSRRARYRSLSEGWMHKHEIGYDAIYLRGDRDDRRDNAVKRDILDQVRLRYNVMAACDDNPTVLALWDEVGIPATMVPGFDGKQPKGTLSIDSPF